MCEKGYVPLFTTLLMRYEYAGGAVSEQKPALHQEQEGR